MTALEQKTAYLQRIFRGMETYGEGTPSEQATRYRFTEMMDDIVARATQQSRTPERAVQLLISLSGFSPATTILAYELLKPRQLLVVSSEKAQESIDMIAGYIVHPSKLRPRDFMHRECEPTDPLGIYQIVRDELRKLIKPGSERPFAMIDITGGKKVMSATAALAAWQLDLALCYIESDFDPEMRQPVPGTERLLLLDNPTTLFGDQGMQNALQMFRNGAYEAARERYEELSNRISEPSKARFMRDLSGMYRVWCDLELEALPACLEAIACGINDPRVRLSSGTADRLRAQLSFLRTLSQRDPLAMLLCYYLLGLHYRELRRHDFAALLFYRTIEGCLTQRLELRFQGFLCNAPNYTLLATNLEELLDRYHAAATTVAPGDQEKRLPHKLSYMNGAVLLFALDDELLARTEINNPKALKYLRRLSEARNQSVLAHGYQSVTGEQSQDIQKLAHRILRAFWELHRHSEDLDRLCDTLRFIRDDT